ncbi:MAG: ABC transporter permease [Vicinamibacterales bacterium]
MNGIPAFETLTRDVRYAARVLRKSPGFTFTAVTTLALALAINIAVFSIVDAVLLRPLPYPRPRDLALVQTLIQGSGASDAQTSQHGVTWLTIRDHATSVDRAVFSGWTSGANVVAGPRASYAEQQRVGAGFFGVLGVAPLYGREFVGDEDRPGGPPAAVLSFHFWRAMFEADPAVVGSSVILRGEPHTIVGIMPDGFHSGVEADLWTPLRPTTTGEGEGENYQVLLRLRPGVSWAQADDDIARLGAEILRQRPAAEGATYTYSIVPLERGFTEGLRQPLAVLWASVAVVLLVACVNLAGLTLARSTRRVREIATRLALGSGRAAILRQLLIESCLIAVAGIVIGLGLSVLAVDALRGLAKHALDVWQPVRIGGRSIAAAAAFGGISATLFGIAPAIQATRMDLQRGLGSGGTRAVAGGASHMGRRLLVVSQVALAMVLLIGAGLLVRTFTHLRSLDPGFDPAHVTAATTSLQDARYRTNAQVTQLVERTLARIRQDPQVQSAAVSLGLPYQRLLNLGFRHLDGPHTADVRGRMTSATYIAGDYFQTLRIPILAGRTFDLRDTTTSPAVVVVNETLARQYFEDGPALRRRISFAGGPREIIGVVGDVQLKPGWGDNGPLAPMPLAYIPLSQASDGMLRLVHGWFTTAFIVRGHPGSAASTALRDGLAYADPLLPIAELRAMQEVQSAAVAKPRLLMTLLATLAGATVLLAGLGIHGLIAASVSERTREIGIRMALGATAANAIRTLAVPGILLAVSGTIVGAFLARGATRLLSHMVWGVTATDPATFIGATVLLIVSAAVASIVAALRILSLDPAQTLRSE